MLLPEIDTEKTANNVRRFLKEDYPRLCRQAGENQSFIKSVVYNGMPKSPSHGNPVEMKITSCLWAQEALRAVYRALEFCSRDSRIIISERYGNHKTAWEAAQMLGYEKTRYHERQNQSYIEFADAFESTGRRLFEDPSRADLHVYKK